MQTINNDSRTRRNKALFQKVLSSRKAALRKGSPHIPKEDKNSILIEAVKYVDNDPKMVHYVQWNKVLDAVYTIYLKIAQDPDLQFLSDKLQSDRPLQKSAIKCNFRSKERPRTWWHRDTVCCEKKIMNKDTVSIQYQKLISADKDILKTTKKAHKQ